MAQRDLAAVGERASEKQDGLGALCSSVWPITELSSLAAGKVPGVSLALATPFLWLLWPTVF